MIPAFPNFKKLELNDKQEVQGFLDKYLPYSDYNFLSLWSYNTEDDIKTSLLNGNLVIRFRDYITNEPFYSFLGDQMVEQTIKQLLDQAAKDGIQQLLKLIPESNLKNGISGELFEVKEDRDNYDYIFSAEEMSELMGRHYHNQRNFLNRFNEACPNATAQPIDIQDENIQTQIISIFNSWAEGKNRPAEETQHELTAIQRTIKDAASFKLFSLGIFEKETLIAYMIADLDHPQYCETHFAKAKPDYPGVFYALYNHFAKQLLLKGYRLINNEQDLGLEGLRFSKSQWNPVSFLKKYTISQK